jgi:hypothetical protein
VHEARVWRATTETIRRGIFAALVIGNKQVESAADLQLVLFESDGILQGNEAQEAFLNNLLGN